MASTLVGGRKYGNGVVGVDGSKSIDVRHPPMTRIRLKVPRLFSYQYGHLLYTPCPHAIVPGGMKNSKCPPVFDLFLLNIATRL